MDPRACQVTARYTRILRKHELPIVLQIYVHRWVRARVHLNTQTEYADACTCKREPAACERAFTYAKGSRYCTAEIRRWHA